MTHKPTSYSMQLLAMQLKRLNGFLTEANSSQFNLIRINGKELEVVSHTKILGLTISNDCMQVENARC